MKLFVYTLITPNEITPSEIAPCEIKCEHHVISFHLGVIIISLKVAKWSKHTFTFGVKCVHPNYSSEIAPSEIIPPCKML